MTRSKTISLRIPSSRPPIFRLGNWLYIDQAFDFGQQHEVLAGDLLDFIQRHRSTIVIARPLTPTETVLAEKLHHDSDHEAAGTILPSGRIRWSRRQP